MAKSCLETRCSLGYKKFCRLHAGAQLTAFVTSPPILNLCSSHLEPSFHTKNNSPAEVTQAILSPKPQGAQSIELAEDLTEMSHSFSYFKFGSSSHIFSLLSNPQVANICPNLTSAHLILHIADLWLLN